MIDTFSRLSPNQIQQLLNQYVLADDERPIHRAIMSAVALRATVEGGALLLQAVDLDDSGPYEIPKPCAITALENYIPPCEYEELHHEVTWYLLTPHPRYQICRPIG